MREQDSSMPYCNFTLVLLHFAMQLYNRERNEISKLLQGRLQRRGFSWLKVPVSYSPDVTYCPPSPLLLPSSRDILSEETLPCSKNFHVEFLWKTQLFLWNMALGKWILVRFTVSMKSHCPWSWRLVCVCDILASKHSDMGHRRHLMPITRFWLLSLCCAMHLQSLWSLSQYSAEVLWPLCRHSLSVCPLLFLWMQGGTEPCNLDKNPSSWGFQSFGCCSVICQISRELLFSDRA